VLHIGGGSNLLFTDDFKGTVLHSKINFIEILDECQCVPEAPAFASSGTPYPGVGKCLLHTNGTSPEGGKTSSKHCLTPDMIRKVIIRIRKEKLPEPSVVGSAGSFFKNPVISLEHFKKIEAAVKAEHGVDYKVPHYDLPDGTVKVPAAWMIEQCGWKGKRSGGAAVWEKQPLVIVNYTGEAYPEEIIGLERRIIDSVKRKFGVDLHPEVDHI
jgi:UDP-N-acetylenolpyruvoylglucosamine reductase